MDSIAQASVGPENDARTGNVMNTILPIKKPQLAVLNGDLVTGDATSRSNSSTYVNRALAPLVKNNVSWASTYRNHDSATNLCPDNVFGRERVHQNWFTQRMVSDPAAGFTNYFLPVFPHSSTAAEVPDVILWFFDKGWKRVFWKWGWIWLYARLGPSVSKSSVLPKQLITI